MYNIQTLVISSEVLNVVAEVDEFKGAWKAYGRQPRSLLQKLQRSALTGTVTSALKLDGIPVNTTLLQELIAHSGTLPLEKPAEQEMAGFLSAVKLVQLHFATMSFSEETMLLLHAELYRYNSNEQWHSGKFKQFPNFIHARDGQGQLSGRLFQGVHPTETPQLIREIIIKIQTLLRNRTLHPLLATSLFYCMFMVVYPFHSGNFRMASLLTQLLMLQSGYSYAVYTSLDAALDQQHQVFQQVLKKTYSTINSYSPEWDTWTRFFLQAFRLQKNHLLDQVLPLQTEDVRAETPLSITGKKILSIVRQTESASIGRIQEFLPDVNRNTLKKQLAWLVANRYLAINGTGKASWYSLL